MANLFDPNAISADPTSMPSGMEHKAYAGLDVGNHLPAGDAAKLAQKAHDDYLHGDIEPDAIEADGKINPVKHALHKFKEAGWEGGTTMALFGTLFLGLSSLGTLYIGGFAGALAGVVATGLVWYGGKAGAQAYRDANEHNQRISQVESEEISAQKERSQAVSQSIETAEELATVASASQTPLAKQEADAPQERPEFIKNILDEGPRSLSPKQLAARIEAERAQTSEQSL